MAVAGPTGPALSREEVDRALARLGAEHEAVESSLLALQDHAGRRLLEGAELAGVTRSRWEATELLITQLWVYFDAYTDALEAARELRGRRRWPTSGELSELTGLLRGTAVTLPAGPPQATAVVSLGVAARLSERLSLTELVERMNSWYAQALDVVVVADAVWSALPTRIDLLAAELGRVRSLAHSVGVLPGEHPTGDDLERLTMELAALRSEVISDPLVFWTGSPPGSAPGGRPDTARYDRAERALEDMRREVEAVLDVRQDAERRLMRVRDVLSRADRTLGEARRARMEVLSKIAAYEVPVVSGPPTVLYEQLETAGEYRRRAAWHRLSPLLESLEQRAEEELLRARESLTAVTAPLAVRAELRGRLDAYKAKAARLGLAEDSLVVERYDVARRMLWSAPCDLVAAEQAVLRYQRAVAGALAPQGTAASTTDGHRGDT